MPKTLQSRNVPNELFANPEKCKELVNLHTYKLVNVLICKMLINHISKRCFVVLLLHFIITKKQIFLFILKISSNFLSLYFLLSDEILLRLNSHLYRVLRFPGEFFFCITNILS